MAVSEKYGKVDIPHIGENEPVFILRAQDKLASETIETYKNMVAVHNPSMMDDLQKALDTFYQWDGPRKFPD